MVLGVACEGSHVVRLVRSPGVGVAVDSGVPGQLVGPAEAFGASGEVASMRFLAGVCPDVSGLVFESVESFLAQRALVRSR